MVKCNQLGSEDVQVAHQFCKTEKSPLLASADPKLGKARTAAASRAIPFHGVRLVTE